VTVSLAVRRALLEDAPALAAFASKAFSDAYRGLDDPNEIANYVEEHFNIEAVAKLIGDRAATTLLAEFGPQLVGYAVLKSADAPGCVAGTKPIELARLYLGTEFVGKGIGAKLMLAVHAEARRLGAATLWLSVYDRNVRAVTFYERFGFTKVGGKEFLFGGRVYIDPVYAAPVRDAA
jgi:ribosomal protein S18 acetylase RimI-like enzyme